MAKSANVTMQITNFFGVICGACPQGFLRILWCWRKLPIDAAIGFGDGKARPPPKFWFGFVNSDCADDFIGYDLMAELSAHYPLQGIALTGYGMEDDVAESRAAGFATHLTKPVRIRMIDEALAKIRKEPGA